MRPLMELSFMPVALAASGNNKNPPSNYTTYKQFIQAVVQHCVDKYGMADVSQWYWEVWNEPDYAGFWTGTIADYYTFMTTRSTASPPSFPARTSVGRRRPSRARSPRSCSTARPRTSA